MRKTFGTVFVLTGVLALVLLAGDSSAQITKGKTRAATTKQLMGGLMRVQSGALKKGLDAGPSSDKEWGEVAISAALLNELSYLLMDDGRCPDGVWKGACETLRTASAATLKAIEAKDLDGAKKASADAGKACGACHKAHKK